MTSRGTNLLVRNWSSWLAVLPLNQRIEEVRGKAHVQLAALFRKAPTLHIVSTRAHLFLTFAPALPPLLHTPDLSVSLDNHFHEESMMDGMDGCQVQDRQIEEGGVSSPGSKSFQDFLLQSEAFQKLQSLQMKVSLEFAERH
jgi:hypothetical protein